MAKNIAILGSTGSIGENALKVIDALGPEYNILAITANSSVKLLAAQAKQYHPRYIAVTDADYYKELVDELDGLKVEILTGADSMVQIAQLSEVDTLITAVVGAAGLPAVLAGAKCGKRLAIANKEPLVIAGKLLTETVSANNAEILPVDSEHSAIFQAIQSGRADEVSRIILTASGGPFRGATKADIENVTLKQALDHPTWNMGPKITIDSATMMNKALEIIEARWLFDIEASKIEVLVHPQSIVHSLVEFVDGSMVAQLGMPDMKLPIQYALTYPNRVAGISEHLKLEQLGTLTFEKPNLEVFRALALGIEVAKTAGSAAAVFNGANEAAVEQFLAGNIKFVTIVELIEHCLNKHNAQTDVSLEQLIEADQWARREVIQCLNQEVY
ncbi:MAG: 1-deoxy-D-xylulose-5-phosphate reductoisomerase [Planctomycetes bacterium]|nr:1-deoxy-D-xylulose-5-phosphate reductoisomerase [Planctomycetota bacterium]